MSEEQDRAAEKWWESLGDDQRASIIEGDHRLDPEIVVSMARAGVLVAGVKWDQDPAFTFVVPPSLGQILDRERRTQDSTE